MEDSIRDLLASHQPEFVVTSEQYRKYNFTGTIVKSVIYENAVAVLTIRLPRLKPLLRTKPTLGFALKVAKWLKIPADWFIWETTTAICYIDDEENSMRVDCGFPEEDGSFPRSYWGKLYYHDGNDMIGEFYLLSRQEMRRINDLDFVPKVKIGGWAIRRPRD